MTTATLSSLNKVLRATRTLGIGTAALLTYVTILLLGSMYVLFTTGLSVAYQAHLNAGYSPLLKGPDQTPTLSLPSSEMRDQLPVHGPSLPLTAPNLEDEVKSVTPEPTPNYDYSTMKVKELKAHAKELGIKSYSKMNKAQLIDTLTTHIVG